MLVLESDDDDVDDADEKAALENDDDDDDDTELLFGRRLDAAEIDLRISGGMKADILRYLFKGCV